MQANAIAHRQETRPFPKRQKSSGPNTCYVHLSQRRSLAAVRSGGVRTRLPPLATDDQQQLAPAAGCARRSDPTRHSRSPRGLESSIRAVGGSPTRYRFVTKRATSWLLCPTVNATAVGHLGPDCAERGANVAIRDGQLLLDAPTAAVGSSWPLCCPTGNLWPGSRRCSSSCVVGILNSARREARYSEPSGSRLPGPVPRGASTVCIGLNAYCGGASRAVVS
jgi:hypothetical protein